jgi:2Fe-2S ferredoxin
VYVHEDWVARVPVRTPDETYMLDEVYDLRGNSRLSCQLIMSEELNGLRVTIARDHD